MANRTGQIASAVRFTPAIPRATMHKAERALTMRTDLIRAYLANRFQNGHVLSFDERDTMELDFLRLTCDRYELRLAENEKPQPVKLNEPTTKDFA